MKINKTGGDSINNESRMRTCRWEKQLKKNMIAPCFIRNFRVVGPGQGMSIHIYRYRKTIHTKKYTYTVVDIKKVFVFDRKLRFARGPRNSSIVVMSCQACSILRLSLGDIAHSSYSGHNDENCFVFRRQELNLILLIRNFCMI